MLLIPHSGKVLMFVTNLKHSLRLMFNKKYRGNAYVHTTRCKIKERLLNNDEAISRLNLFLYLQSQFL